MSIYTPFKCRASSVGSLMTRASASDFGQGTKDVVLADVLYKGYDYYKQINAKQIDKGNKLEDEAIRMVGLINALSITKNQEFRFNKWFTGTCDILTPTGTRDTKCVWSADSFPWTDADAIAAVKKGGYDWQGMIYMMLWGVKEHWVDFVLLPTPKDLLKFNDDEDLHINLVNRIPIEKRIKSVKIMYDEDWIAKAKQRVDDVQEYHKELWQNLIGGIDNE